MNTFKFTPGKRYSFTVGHPGFPTVVIRPGDVVMVLTPTLHHGFPCFFVLSAKGVIFKMTEVERNPDFVRVEDAR